MYQFLVSASLGVVMHVHVHVHVGCPPVSKQQRYVCSMYIKAHTTTQASQHEHVHVLVLHHSSLYMHLSSRPFI